MATVPELIYCANGNERFAQIAIDAGFTFGAQLPGTVYFPPQFVDQDWKRPNRAAYMAALAEHRPRLATVLDWERVEQLPEVLGWAEDAAQYVTEAIIIIPKVVNGVDMIPDKIGGVRVRLGYSVPTKHGGTAVPTWEFVRREVHLLGGSPHAQKRIARYLNAVSVDGNMMQKMAVRYAAFYDPLKQTQRGSWPSIKGFDGQKWGDGGDAADAPYEAFRRSCHNIAAYWHGGEFIKREDVLCM